MKKFLLPMLALAALSACSNDDNNLNDGPVPIRLNAGLGVEVKAPVDPTDPDAANITAGIIGRNTNENWETTITFKPSTTAQAVTFAQNQYYPNDGSDVTMYAWYPQDALTGDDVTFTKTDGTIDVMHADLTANKASGVQNLSFEHKLAQIYFTVTEDDETGVQEDLGIKSITIQEVATPKSMNVTTGVVTANTAANLAVPGLPMTIDGASGAKAGEPVMVMPSSTATYTLVIVTSDEESYTKEVTFSNEGGVQGLVAGTAYNVQVTFGRTQIQLTASVAAWKSGSATPVTIK